MKYTFLFALALIALGLGYLAFSEVSAPTVAVEKTISNDRFFDE